LDPKTGDKHPSIKLSPAVNPKSSSPISEYSGSEGGLHLLMAVSGMETFVIDLSFD